MSTHYTHAHRTVTLYELPEDPAEQCEYAIKRLGAYRRCTICDRVGFKPYLDGPIRWLSPSKAQPIREAAREYNAEVRA
jgi:hypothetical protein